MKTIVIGDVHGCYNELKSLLTTLTKEGEYNKKKDKIVFLGDYIDRGKDSCKVIGLIKRMQKHNKNVVALMGNHEDMLISYQDAKDTNWEYNGCDATIESYKGNFQYLAKDIEWMRNLPLYHEDEHFIYVHGGIDINKPMEEQDRNTLLWIREPFIYNTKKYHKRVIFGHTPTFSINGDSKPISTYNNNVAIDTGCVFGGMLTALIIEDGKIDGFYQQEKAEEHSTTLAFYGNNKKKKYIKKHA